MVTLDLPWAPSFRAVTSDGASASPIAALPNQNAFLLPELGLRNFSVTIEFQSDFTIGLYVGGAEIVGLSAILAVVGIRKWIR